MDDLEFSGPESEDYTISPCEPLGSRYTVGQFEVRFLGEFVEYDDAISAIHAHMDKNQFWPNVWMISDHGNAELVTA